MIAESSNKKIKKLLIANRSEISLRIQATCRALGIKTVAIYAPEDKGSAFVVQADESYPLSLFGSQAYLNKSEILSIAVQASVDAIHPGYGFLAENYEFAQKVQEIGLTWVGPTPLTMQMTGDKASARKLASQMHVAVCPGEEFLPTKEEGKRAQEYAAVLGYPIIIKDSLAGGGKAMRKVYTDAAFEQAWQIVVSEGKRFGFSGAIVVEKCIEQARHVEVQIAGDGAEVVHLFERECSVQRNNQKIIEEAPCIFLDELTRNKMYDAACLLAKSAQYKGVGTVEFLVDQDQNFYFLEINARLQVEHSVTELTTGIDLVALQLHIAETSTLPFKQADIKRIGHAIECRIYAEDPYNNFLPSTGVITHFSIPHLAFARIDCDLSVGYEITPFFDPMIAKITTRGFNRAESIMFMSESLKRFFIKGIKTNQYFLMSILKSVDFQEGRFFTHLLNDNSYRKSLPDMLESYEDKELHILGIAGAVIHHILLKANGLGQGASIKKASSFLDYKRWKEVRWKQNI